MYTLRTNEGKIIYSDTKVINILLYYCNFQGMVFDNYYSKGISKWVNNYSIYQDEVKYIVFSDNSMHITHRELYFKAIKCLVLTESITETENQLARLGVLLDIDECKNTEEQVTRFVTIKECMYYQLDLLRQELNIIIQESI